MLNYYVRPGALLGLFAAMIPVWGLAQEPYEVRSIKNSESFSQAIAVNAKLEILGTREIIDSGVGTVKNFFRSGETETEIGVPKGFTNIEVQALSDSSLVVGYVSRPIGSAGGSIHAFAWDGNKRNLVLLPTLPGDLSAHAQDVSADGTRVSGYSIGNNPPRMRPCVWQWNGPKETWECTVLTTIQDRNPFLQASHVIISPDGKRVAACITEREISEFIVDSSLHVWESDSQGQWIRRKISDEQMAIKDMNDKGDMVGSIIEGVASVACRMGLDGKLEKYSPLPNDESTIAYGINNAGVIVGMSDDPHGADGGPQAVLFQAGKTLPLPLPKDTVDSSALAINQAGVIAGLILRGNSESEVPSAFIAVPTAK